MCVIVAKCGLADILGCSANHECLTGRQRHGKWEPIKNYGCFFRDGLECEWVNTLWAGWKHTWRKIDYRCIKCVVPRSPTVRRHSHFSPTSSRAEKNVALKLLQGLLGNNKCQNSKTLLLMFCTLKGWNFNHSLKETCFFFFIQETSYKSGFIHVNRHKHSALKDQKKLLLWHESKPIWLQLWRDDPRVTSCPRWDQRGTT